jgi:predicted outer membrane protein
VRVDWIAAAEMIPVVLMSVACTPASRPPPTGEAPLADGQIAEIDEAVDYQQTQTARLAAGRASDRDVHAFADELLADHGQEQRAQRHLLARTRTDSEPSILTGRFESAAREARAWLSNESGPSFDRDFLDSEIKEQTRQLDWLDHILVPAAHDAGLREELLHRRAVAEHLLDEAKRLFLRFPAAP